VRLTRTRRIAGKLKVCLVVSVMIKNGARNVRSIKRPRSLASSLIHTTDWFSADLP
jgi:hypothetical protein